MTANTRILAASLIGISIATSAHAVEKKPATSETIREDLIVAHCKDEAKKYYSFIHLKKRRVFERNCIERARR
jgi:hypothetical protein